jgi:hypothetical protein
MEFLLRNLELAARNSLIINDDKSRTKLYLIAKVVNREIFNEGELKFPPLALTMQCFHEPLNGVGTFGWRGLVAKVENGEILFYPEQLDVISWKDYPKDAHCFIEWISHHQRIIFEKFNYGQTELKPYSVDFN